MPVLTDKTAKYLADASLLLYDSGVMQAGRDGGRAKPSGFIASTSKSSELWKMLKITTVLFRSFHSRCCAWARLSSCLSRAIGRAHALVFMAQCATTLLVIYSDSRSALALYGLKWSVYCATRKTSPPYCKIKLKSCYSCLKIYNETNRQSSSII